MNYVLGAPTNLGLKPYDDGSPRRVVEAPSVLRQLGLATKLGASDLGDVVAGPYRDFDIPQDGVRNATAIAEHARRLATAVADAPRDARLLVFGGDCSILLGTLLGLQRRGRHGLVYVDGHCDFATPALSESGGAAGMDTALALGRADHPLARLGPDGPLMRAGEMAMLARKDLADEAMYYKDASITRTNVLDLPLDRMRELGLDLAADRALQRMRQSSTDGFLVHFDVDVLRPEVMPAVDSPEPGGLTLDEAAHLLRRLLESPKAAALQVTIYDPGLDKDLECGRRLVELLVDALS